MKAQRITNRFPLIGPIVWILSAQYFLVQILVASYWHPAYDWSTNLISDLGNTACGAYSGRYVCSPQHGLMNASFVLLGLTMSIGSLLIYQQFPKTSTSRLGFMLMGLAGIGTMLVGLFPENTVPAMHFVGALLGLMVGNISLVLLAFGLRRVKLAFRIYSFVSGVISLTALILFESHIYLGIGQGNTERVIGYPQTAWLIVTGLYMIFARARAHATER